MAHQCPICKVTQDDVKLVPTQDALYYIECPDCGKYRTFGHEHILENTKIDDSRYLLSGAIRWHTDMLLQQYHDYEDTVMIHFEDMDAFRVNRDIKWMKLPKTITERREVLFRWIGRKVSVNGVPMLGIQLPLRSRLIKNICFTSEDKEAERLITQLTREGMIECTTTSIRDPFVYIALTYDGCRELEKIAEVRSESKTAFIAMKFLDRYNNLKESLIDAIEGAGYEPVRIDEYIKAKPDSKATIDARIISEIKTSRFMIADFTDDNAENVYYEAGYAYGLGIPVISCCRKDRITDKEKGLPFDRRNYHHHEWEDSFDSKAWEKFAESIKHAIIAEPGVGKGPKQKKQE